MAYTLNTVDLANYDIIPGHIGGANIALKGCFDFPSRIGVTEHAWGDENGVEPWVEADELFFGGRDIDFTGHITGSKFEIYSNLVSLYELINSQASGTVVFATPYGNYNVYVKNLIPVHYNGACLVNLHFREPVATLTGGSIPSAASGGYKIDNVPMSSYGLYYSGSKDIVSLPELKEQFFTTTEVEGYQISKRGADKFNFTGFVMANDLASFQQNIKNLYALYSSPGTKVFNLNGEIEVTCFPKEGFSIGNIVYCSDKVVAQFRSSLTVISLG